MSILDSLFGWAKPKESKIPEQPMYTTVTVTTESKPKKPRKPRVKKPAPEPVAEKPAVAADPVVKVVKLDFDPANPRLGSLELDWNDEFIQLLAQHGYQGGKPEEIVDAWLNDICRTILNNQYPGSNVTILDNARFVKRQNLGDGKTEVS
jgi:hypothetical protein